MGLLGLAVLAPTAGAEHSVVELAPSGLVWVSEDGSLVLFVTEQRLVSEDNDSVADIYERDERAGTTTRISIGPEGGNGPFAAFLAGASQSGSRVFFETQEPLASEDADSGRDIYERSGETTTLISIGADTPFDDVGFVRASQDGFHVLFCSRGLLYERSGGTTTLFWDRCSFVSEDATRGFLSTRERLLLKDMDSSVDIYDRFSGETRLVSIGPAGGNGPYDVLFRGASADGSRLFFVTEEGLVPEDTDSRVDIYESSGRKTILVSSGPRGGNGPFGAFFRGASADGTHVFFQTRESLVDEDPADGAWDIYDRSAGTTALVSLGAGGIGAFDPRFLGASADGSRVFFATEKSLVSEDTDSNYDIYERSEGRMTLISIGPDGGNGPFNVLEGSANNPGQERLFRLSDDGSRVFFETRERLVSADTDSALDIYERAGGQATLISIGPRGGNGPYDAYLERVSADGSHVFFKTQESLVSADTDASGDTYVARIADDTIPPETAIDSGPSGTVNSTNATFAFSGTDPRSTFACSLDGLPFASCASPKTYTGLSNEVHTFAVRATDSAGNTDPTPASRTWTIDTLLLTTIHSGPSGTVNSTNATFAFSATDPGSTFACSLDGLPFASCTSPTAYTGLIDGAHTFAVRATDSVGTTDPTPARRSWTIDTVPPTAPASLVASLSVATPTGELRVTLTWARSTDSSGVTEYEIYSNGAPAERVPGTRTAAGVGHDLGSTTYAVRARDGAGNWSSFSAPATVNTPFAVLTPEANMSVVLGGPSYLGLGVDLSPYQEAYLRFRVTGLPAPVTSAKLRFWAYNGTPDGPALFMADSNWVESGITWDNRPERTSGIIANTGAIADGSFVDYDVTSAVTGDGTYTFNLVPESADALFFWSTGIDCFEDDHPPNCFWPALIISVAIPQTTIDSGPVGLVSSSSASFTFTSDAPGATFECQLDGSGFAPCASPQAYSGLGDGVHGFQVRAMDPTGVADPTPAGRSWTIDTSGKTTLTFSAEADARLEEANPDTNYGSDTALVVGLSPNREAYLRFTVTGVTGSVLSAKLRLFRTSHLFGSGPAVFAAGSSWSETGITWRSRPARTSAVIQNEGGATFSGNDPTWVEYDVSSVVTGNGTYSFNVGQFSLFGSDTHFNSRESAANTPELVLMIQGRDTTPSETTIESAPMGLVNSATAAFTFSSDNPTASFECSLDGTAFSSCTSPRTYAGLADGAHAFEVRAHDTAGNVDPTPASRTWTVDTTPPETTIDSGPMGAVSSTAATFAFSSGDASASFECSLDGAAFASCASPLTYGSLSEGDHAFEVRAVDAAGNVDPTPATWLWTVDTTPPETGIDSGTSGFVNATSAAFTFSASEDSSTFECSLDSAPFASCTSPQAYPDLAEGSHTFEVRATDAAGNTDPTPARRSWTVDTTPPSLALSATPDELWPPNHWLIPILVTIEAADKSGVASVLLVSVASSEPDDGLGDGDTAEDIAEAELGTRDTELQLRAERSAAGEGRTYTLTYQATDLAGNVATASVTVHVPRSARDGRWQSKLIAKGV